MSSDRHLDTLWAFAIVAGVILAGVVLLFAVGLLLGPWLIQRGFTTDIPK